MAIGDRLRTWREVSGRLIDFVNLDLANEYDRLIAILRELRPDAIVHFAEQRAAPYSMRSPATKRYTVDNNVRATHNPLAALVHSGIDAAIAPRPTVLNQVTETHRVIDLAKLVGDTTGVEIAHLPNPRVEAEENDLVVRNDHFLALGLRPTTLSQGLLPEVRDVAARHALRQ